MTDLVTWLRAQLDDDARVARQLAAVPTDSGFYLEAETEKTDLMAVAGHVFRWTPARVLAEVDAKRRILDLAVRLDEHDGECVPQFLEALALPYADRDGYREEWRP